MEKVGQQTSLNKFFYHGYSWEEKPILLKEHNDSRIFELDTGKKYIWHNEKWVSEPEESYSSIDSFTSGFGEQIVGDVNMAFVSNFAYQSDTRKLQQILSNGGTVTNPNSMLKVSSGVNASGSAIGRSRRSLPYKAGQEAFCFFTAMWDSPALNNKRFVGLFDNLNGFAIGYNGLDFGVLRRKNSVDTEFIKQSDFNNDKLDGTGSSGFTIDKAKLNVFRISFIYLGGGSIKYWVLTDNGWLNFHTIKYQNRNTTTHISLPYLKISVENVNNGNTIDVSIYSASVACGSIGGYNKIISSRTFNRKINKSITAGIDNVISIFHLKENYGVIPVENRVESLLKYLTVATDGTKNVTFERWKLAVTPVGGVWVDVSPNSMIEVDNTITSVDLTGAELTFAVSLAKADSKAFDLLEQEIRSLPNDYIVYIMTSTGASDVSLTTSWDELF